MNSILRHLLLSKLSGTHFEACILLQRVWSEYESGFGSLTGEHWLGLTNQQLVTNDSSKNYTLRIYLTDFSDITAWGEFLNYK